MPSHTSSTTFRSLADSLEEALPADARFRVYYLSTPPTKCAPLFSVPPGGNPERTYCESHFLTVSIHPPSDNIEATTNEMLILGVEVLVFTTSNLTTVFVSKADSTGFLALLNLPRSTTSPLRSITTVFISWIVQKRQRSNVKLVLSLFARASNQYLFPGSVENTAKHVSTDRQLIKWWCRVLDPLVQQCDPGKGRGENKAITSQAYLIVPGEDTILSFLPDEVRFDPQLRKRWTQGHPLREITAVPAAPPRCLIPHFPDDPKARYLDELDDELQDTTESRNSQSPSKRGNGRWRSVKSLEQFWEMMAFRQECSAGRLVGFIWILFTPAHEVECCTDDLDRPSILAGALRVRSTLRSLNTAPRLETAQSTPTELSKSKTIDENLPRKRGKQLTGPITARMPRIKKATSSRRDSIQPEESQHYYWPPDSRGELVLDDKEYKKATELLLRLDFASFDLAAKSTRTWIDEVGVLCGVGSTWGKLVVGKAMVTPALTTTNGSDTAAARNAPTVLVTKKKRKAEEDTIPDGEGLAGTVSADAAKSDSLEASAGAVNLLGAGLVRKKIRITPEQDNEIPVQNDMSTPTAVPVINVLGAGLIRKKPKAA